MDEKENGWTYTVEQISERDKVLAKIVADYDRRMQHWWGRFLLWLLRKTT